ncbi:YihY/virulence factor BrkB family protein [Anaerolineales bacterium]
MKILKDIFDLIKTTFQEWNADGAPMLAAALAYYTAFAIAPLIIIVLAITGLIVSQDQIENEILTQIQSNIGPQAGELVQGLITNTTQADQGIISSIISVVLLLMGALGVFNNLQIALDQIWDVDEVKRPGGIKAFFKDKLLSFGMLLVIGFLLLVSLVISTMLAFVDGYMANLLPGADVLLRFLSLAITLGVTTVLFMAIFKFLPHARIQWRDVAIGAFVSAVLFTIGRNVLGLYLANTATSSTYGAAGALVVILLWVNYSAQIILFGAEFTQVFARRYGSKILSSYQAKTDASHKSDPSQPAEREIAYTEAVFTESELNPDPEA